MRVQVYILILVLFLSTPRIVFTSGAYVSVKSLLCVFVQIAKETMNPRILREVAHMEPIRASPTTSIDIQEGSQRAGIHSVTLKAIVKLPKPIPAPQRARRNRSQKPYL